MSPSDFITSASHFRAACRRMDAIAKPVATASVAMLCATLMANHAFAFDRNGLFGNSVSLPCWIENEKVIAVVNATGKTLPAGTTLSVNAVPMPDGEHFVRRKTIARTPSGGIIRIGAVPSSSCTASVTQPRPDLKSQ